MATEKAEFILRSERDDFDSSKYFDNFALGAMLAAGALSSKAHIYGGRRKTSREAVLRTSSSHVVNLDLQAWLMATGWKNQLRQWKSSRRNETTKARQIGLQGGDPSGQGTKRRKRRRSHLLKGCGFLRKGSPPKPKIPKLCLAAAGENLLDH